MKKQPYIAYYLSMRGNIRKAALPAGAKKNITKACSATTAWGATHADGGVAKVEVYRSDWTPGGPFGDYLATCSPYRFGCIHTWTPGRHPREVMAAMTLAECPHDDMPLPILSGDLILAEIFEDGDALARHTTAFGQGGSCSALPGGSYEAWVAEYDRLIAALDARAREIGELPCLLRDSVGRLAGVAW